MLDRKIFTTLWEAPVLIEEWRTTYNQIRPHSSLGNRPPAPEAIMPVSAWLTTPATSNYTKEALIAGLT